MMHCIKCIKCISYVANIRFDSTMLYLQVLGLLSIVLYQLMRESEEKWKKLSRQVIDLVLPLATKQQVRRSS